MDKYCFSLNFFSRLFSCWVVKGVLGFLMNIVSMQGNDNNVDGGDGGEDGFPSYLFGLCFLSVHRRGPIGGRISVDEKC